MKKTSDGVPLTPQEKNLLGKQSASDMSKAQLMQTESPSVSPMQAPPTKLEALRQGLVDQRNASMAKKAPPAYTPPVIPTYAQIVAQGGYGPPSPTPAQVQQQAQVAAPQANATAPVTAAKVAASPPPATISTAVAKGAEAQGGTQVGQTVAQKLAAPVTADQAKKSVDYMAKFLAANPDGATLANILDAVGVGLSAAGGTQRQTMLQQRKAAQLQLAQQQAMAQQSYQQDSALKAQDLQNQIAKTMQDLSSNQQLMTQEQKNATALKMQDLQNQLAMIAPNLAADIQRPYAQLGVSQVAQSGNTDTRVGRWTTPGGQ
jgi:hypothetical protein